MAVSTNVIAIRSDCRMDLNLITRNVSIWFQRWSPHVLRMFLCAIAIYNQPLWIVLSSFAFSSPWSLTTCSCTIAFSAIWSLGLMWSQWRVLLTRPCCAFLSTCPRPPRPILERHIFELIKTIIIRMPASSWQPNTPASQWSENWINYLKTFVIVNTCFEENLRSTAVCGSQRNYLSRDKRISFKSLFVVVTWRVGMPAHGRSCDQPHDRAEENSHGKCAVEWRRRELGWRW